MDHSTVTPAAHPQYTVVETTDTYRRLVRVLASVPRFAIDIEGDSLYHYYEKVCLIQISTDNSTFILDPLAVKDLSQLSRVLDNGGVEKVLHAAAYDVSCLRRDYGFTFSNIFDTHIAARLLGYEQLGLSTLLREFLGVAHSKRRQRDDWSRRPLKPEQLEYAAMDTHHLIQLRDALESDLRGKGRLAWAKDEFQWVAEMEVQEKVFDPEGYRRIRGSRELSPKGLSILRALYGMRDRFARQMDVPPFKVLNNSVLLDLARKPPASRRDLSGRPGISKRLARSFSHEIFQTIVAAGSQELASSSPAARNSSLPMPREAKARLGRLRHWRQAKSEELHLPVGVIFPGNLLEAIAASAPADTAGLESLHGMRHWRVQEFGQEILNALAAP